MKKAIVLLSGGLDSATSAAVAVSEGYEVCALSFDYGQRHKKELECASKVARFLDAKEHIIINFDLRAWGGSALTDDIDVPRSRDLEEMSLDIPVTYVPARNIIFLSFALSYAEAVGAYDIFIGVNQLDYSGYPDCRDEFIRSFEQTANLGTKAGVEGNAFHIHTPLIDKTKAEIIKLGLSLGVDYGLTWSCYVGEDVACGECDSCKLRLEGFRQAGAKDPIAYRIS
jgi:7-cyano-7-deazaguanine synthase